MAKNPNYGQKAVKVMELLNKNPNYADTYVALKANCHPTYVKQLRKKMIHAQEEVLKEEADAEFLYKLSQGRQKRKEKPTHQFIEISEEVTRELSGLLNGKTEPTSDGSEILREMAQESMDALLAKREAQYGSFMFNANIAIRLKSVMHNAIAQKDVHLAPDQMLALDMIAVKISRILSGNPSHLDSWLDIAGYAKLVSDRLEGNIR